MRKILFISLILLLQSTYAQKKKKKTTFTIVLEQNSVLGQNTVLFGTTGIKPKLKFTFYSKLWNALQIPTSPDFEELLTSFGVPFNSPEKDIYLETGVGLGFIIDRGRWFINPTLGFGHGKLLSGTTETKLAESFIPSILMIYNSKRFEIETHFAFYKSIRGQEKTTNLVSSYIISGYKVSKTFSFGIFYETFSVAKAKINNLPPEISSMPMSINGFLEKPIYQSIGPYVKLHLKEGIWFRFAAGSNRETDLGTSNEFYKIQAYIPF